MPQSGTYGSVGAAGGQPPAATRPPIATHEPNHFVHTPKKNLRAPFNGQLHARGLRFAAIFPTRKFTGCHMPPIGPRVLIFQSIPPGQSPTTTARRQMHDSVYQCEFEFRFIRPSLSKPATSASQESECSMSFISILDSLTCYLSSAYQKTTTPHSQTSYAKGKQARQQPAKNRQRPSNCTQCLKYGHKYIILPIVAILSLTCNVTAHNTPGEPRHPLTLSNPDDSFRDCDICPEMVLVPSGSYIIGSPLHERGRQDNEGPPQHIVIDKSFALSKYEITRGEFSRFVEETGYPIAGCSELTDKLPLWRPGHDWRSPGMDQTDSHPVTCVNWIDAQAYVGWLSVKTTFSYRLPSESEWEYAARAGTYWTRHWGESDLDACNYANVADQAAKARFPLWRNVFRCADNHVYTASVGSYKPNPWKLHDVLGNVWEWVEDCYKRTYAGIPTDGSAWIQGNCSQRAVRGGAWNSFPTQVRSALRDSVSSHLRTIIIGFRVVRTMSATH